MADISKIKVDATTYNIKDETARSDVSSLSSQKVDKTAITNPNLLDNPWFTVNQRGATQYTAWQYGVDRWKSSVNTTTINGSTITLQPSAILLQPIENISVLAGRTVTASILDANGNIHSGTTIIQSGSGDKSIFVDDKVGATYNYTDSIFYIGAVGSLSSSISIRAVKLELGSISTLAMDTAPNYATELLKCQRYLNVLIDKAFNATNRSTNYFWIYIPTPTKMRQAPSLENGDIRVYNGSDLITGFSTTFEATDSMIGVKLTKSAYGLQDSAKLIAYFSGRVCLSADL